MSGYIMDLRKEIGSRCIILTGAGVILEDNLGRILLQRRTDNHCWGIPGGSMELGETFEDTARREVLEETGLIVGELNLFYLNSGPSTHYTYPNGDEVYQACTVFTSSDFSGDITLQEDESEDTEWFYPHQIPDNINPPDRVPLQKFAASRNV